MIGRQIQSYEAIVKSKESRLIRNQSQSQNVKSKYPFLLYCSQMLTFCLGSAKPQQKQETWPKLQWISSKLMNERVLKMFCLLSTRIRCFKTGPKLQLSMIVKIDGVQRFRIRHSKLNMLWVKELQICTFKKNKTPQML